jgi:hypothetical protein
MNKTTPFLIAFTQPVIFRDRTGTVLKTYEIGDVVPATADNGSHFETAMGGIYHTEARKVDGEELITYAHANGGSYKYRFRQFVKDPLPAWACDFKLDAA